MSNPKPVPASPSAQIFALEQPDASGVLTSTRAVVLAACAVSLDYPAIQRLARKLVAPEQTPAGTEQASALPDWPAHYHFFDGSERTVNWLLLLDALNFCFWSEKNQPRWQIVYQGEVLNGYWAEAAALRRAVEEGKPVWDAEYLSTIDAQELAAIF